MIRPLVSTEIPALAAVLAELPLMVRYKRTADAIKRCHRSGGLARLLPDGVAHVTDLGVKQVQEFRHV